MTEVLTEKQRSERLYISYNNLISYAFGKDSRPGGPLEGLHKELFALRDKGRDDPNRLENMTKVAKRLASLFSQEFTDQIVRTDYQTEILGRVAIGWKQSASSVTTVLNEYLEMAPDTARGVSGVSKAYDRVIKLVERLERYDSKALEAFKTMVQNVNGSESPFASDFGDRQQEGTRSTVRQAADAHVGLAGYPWLQDSKTMLDAISKTLSAENVERLSTRADDKTVAAIAVSEWKSDYLPAIGQLVSDMKRTFGRGFLEEVLGEEEAQRLSDALEQLVPTKDSAPGQWSERFEKGKRSAAIALG